MRCSQKAKRRTFKGKFIAYRLSDGARLSSVQVEAANSEHVSIEHGSPPRR